MFPDQEGNVFSVQHGHIRVLLFEYATHLIETVQWLAVGA
jgi:hypothetical protein